jgi:hypothetical protein
MADDGHEGGWIMAGRPEEYLLYVRVPDPEDEQLDTTSGFLERLARLLNDEDAKIYVEDYRTYVEGEQHTHGRHGDGELDADGVEHSGNSPDSHKKNSLRPLYFCHNKF